jgi:hypothetical protein
MMLSDQRLRHSVRAADRALIINSKSQGPQTSSPPALVQNRSCSMQKRVSGCPCPLVCLMKVIIKFPTREDAVALTVEPSDTVGAALARLLLSHSMGQRPEGQQCLALGDVLLNNERTFADLCIKHEATLKFVDTSLQLGITTTQTAPSALYLQPSTVAKVHEHDSQVSLPCFIEEQLDVPLTAAPPPSSPRLMLKIDPSTVHNVRRAPSLQADILCRLVGQSIYEFERTDGEWALVSASEYERLKATDEAFIDHDASVEGWCILATDGVTRLVSLDVDNMEAAIVAHRSLVTRCASSSWSIAAALPALQTMFHDESLSVQAYACIAAGSWCLDAIVTAAIGALPILSCIMHLCDSSAPLLRCKALTSAWALAVDLTSSHPSAAGDILSEFLNSSLTDDNEEKLSAALSALAASITTLQRRCTLFKAGLMPLLLRPLKCKGNREVFGSAVWVCSCMCDRSNSSEVNPLQKEVILSGVLPLVVTAFEDPADADAQSAASKMLWYLTRHANDELIAAGIPALKVRLLSLTTNAGILKTFLMCIGNYFRESKTHADVFVRLGALNSIVALLAHENPEIQEHASSAIIVFSGVGKTIQTALCDAGAVGALTNIVSKGSGIARQRACVAVWGLVLGGVGGQAGIDAVIGLIGGDAEEGIKAGLAGLSAAVEGSEVKQRVYVELFGVGRLVGLLGHESVGVQSKACYAIQALTGNCAFNQDAFRQGGAVAGLVIAMSCKDTDLQKNAAAAAFNMLVGNSENKDTFLQAGFAVVLCKLLQSHISSVQTIASSCIQCICSLQHVKIQNAFRDEGCTMLLLRCLSSSFVDDNLHFHACEALAALSDCSLAAHIRAVTQLYDSDVIDSLLKSSCGLNARTLRRIVHAAAFDIVQQLVSSRASVFWEPDSAQSRSISVSTSAGFTIAYYLDGRVYVGQCENGKSHGRGWMRYADRSCYDGDWSDGEKHGKGILKYALDYKEPIQTRFNYMWNAGDKYDGGWKHDKRHGVCKYTFFNGSTLECDWMDDLCPEFAPLQCIIQARFGKVNDDPEAASMHAMREDASKELITGLPDASPGSIHESLSCQSINRRTLDDKQALESAKLLVDEIVSVGASSLPVAPRPAIFSLGFDMVMLQRALASADENHERALDIMLGEQNYLYACSDFAGNTITGVTPIPAPVPSINFSLEWLDEGGLVCPKNVNFLRQCPKGHSLQANGSILETPFHQLSCRICHKSCSIDQAAAWLRCSVNPKCCCEYSVCSDCALAADDMSLTPAVAASDSISTLVSF